MQGADLGRRYQLDEVRQRYLATGRVQGQAAELVERAPVGGQAHADIDLVGGVFRSVCRQFQAIADHLYGVADAQHVGAEARGRLAIDLDPPLDAGQGTVILDVLEAADAEHAGAQLLDESIGLGRIQGAYLQLDRLAAAGALFLSAELEDHAGNVGTALAHVGKNLSGRTPLMPIDELELQGADHVDPELAVRLGQGAGVQRLDFGHAEQTAFDLLQQGVLFLHRQVAAGAQPDLRVFRLDLGKELHPMVVAAVTDIDQGNQREYAEQGQARPAQQLVEQFAVGLGATAGRARQRLRATAGHRAQYRQEHQGHGQGGEQADDHRGRQVFHELADHPGPEQQRQEYHQGGGGGGDHRPGHSRRRVGPGLARVLALMQVAVGQLGNDDGAIHQHPGDQDQAEQHDYVEGEAEHPDQQDAGQEGAGNGQADQQRRAQAHARHHQDQHQDNGGHHVVEQVAEQALDFLRLIHDVADLQACGQQRLGLDHQCLDLLDGGDDVGAAALGHFQDDGGLAVDPGEAGRILEGAVNAGDIAEGHHAAADHLDRHGQHVFQILDDPGHLQAHAPGAGVQAAGGNQAVVAGDQVEQLAVVDAVTVEYLLVDDDFQQVFAVAAGLHREHLGDAFDVFLQLTGDIHQLRFGDRPGQAYRQHRKQRHVDFGDRRFIGFLRQFAACGIDLFAHVDQGRLGVEAGIEFQGHRGLAFVGHRTHFLDCFEAAQLLFQRAHQQAFGVFRADAFQGHRDIDDRDADVRVGFLGDGHIGGQAADQQKGQQQQAGAAAVQRRGDQGVHFSCPRWRVG